MSRASTRRGRWYVPSRRACQFCLTCLQYRPSTRRSTPTADLHLADSTPSTPPTHTARIGRRLLLSLGAVLVYSVLLFFSHRVERTRWALPAVGPSPTVHTTDGETWIPLYYRDTPPSTPTDRPAVVLLHGTPGDGNAFNAMAGMLSKAGWRVIVPDLLGAGQSIDPRTRTVPSHSMQASAFALRDVLDRAGAERAHLVGWSNGGGVALLLSEVAPERVASITLLASIGAQETEGSGGYYFEHLKYAIGVGVLEYLPDLLPHFGILGTRSMREQAIQPFWDSDQRPLKGLMHSLHEKHIPAMVLHGRHDFLVGARAAEQSHEIMPESVMVILDSDHFMPFMRPELPADELASFFRAVETGTDNTLARVRDDAPAWFALGRFQKRVEDALYPLPWPVQLALFAALIFIAPLLGISFGAMIVARGVVDILVMMIAAMIAFGLRSDDKDATRPPDPLHWSRRRSMAWKIARSLCAGVVVIAVARLCNFAVLHLAVYRLYDLSMGWLASGIALVAGSIATGAAGFAFPLFWTQAGRRRLVAKVRRLHHEYWPIRVFYLVPVAYLVCLSFRRRGVGTITCANPGLGVGGGIIGESKSDILRAIDRSPHVMPWRFLRADHDVGVRVRTVMEWISDPDSPIGSFPIVLKPDSGFHGYAVKLSRSERDLRVYLSMMHRDLIVQAFHPGPKECAIVWARGGNTRPGNLGTITGLNLRELPTVKGDGKHTLEQLVLRHKRHRAQARTILRNLGEQRNDVPARDGVVRVSNVGNHIRGTRFRDGSHLVTPELEDTIDAIARAVLHPSPTQAQTQALGAGGLDIGRFDTKYDSDELLVQGKGIGIVELNGTTGEPTQMYDPSRSVFWAWCVYCKHIRTVFDLAFVRRKSGVSPASIGELYRGWRAHHKDKPDI